MQATEKNGPTPDTSEQPPFNHPIEYVIRTWLHFDRYKLYPEEGPYNAQCPLLMDDWHTMNVYQVRVKHGIVSSMTLDLDGAVSDLNELAGG